MRYLKAQKYDILAVHDMIIDFKTNTTEQSGNTSRYRRAIWTHFDNLNVSSITLQIHNIKTNIINNASEATALVHVQYKKKQVTSLQSLDQCH